MSQIKLPFADWSWDQLVLILGPVLVSVLLFVLYATDRLAVGWPGLVVLVLLVNLAGDVAYALKDEYSVRHGRVALSNDVVGRRGVAEEAFREDGSSYSGAVRVAGERWRAVSEERLDAGSALRVVDRRGLVLQVVPDRGTPQGVE